MISFAVVVLLCSAFGASSTVYAQEVANKNVDEEKLNSYEDLISFLMYDAVIETLDKHYDKGNTGIVTFRIIEIKRSTIPDNVSRRVTVSFESYHGAHNPPYHKNIVTYDLYSAAPLKIKEVDFQKHHIQELSPLEEWFH
jgi:hypothetical protein